MNQFTDEVERTIDALKTKGISVKVRVRGSRYMRIRCVARFADGRDPVGTNADTVERAVRQTSDLVRGIWDDLFESRAA